MQIRWSPEAANDLSQIVQHIRKQNPGAGLRIARTMYKAVGRLNTFSNRGRLGRVDGTRELVLSPLPLIVVYRVNKIAVEIARVLHGAQQWP
jgi:toxin ParE1/3/4